LVHILLMEILIIVYGKDLFKQKKTIPSDIFKNLGQLQYKIILI
jgi:hypothetical protein